MLEAAKSAKLISRGAKQKILIIPTNEELEIARQSYALIRGRLITSLWNGFFILLSFLCFEFQRYFFGI